VAAEPAREIIEGSAARMADIYVRDITVVQAEPPEGWSP
jgi:hypothetical protein